MINFEAGAAWLAEKVVIPVCFGGLTLNALPKPYSNFQAVELPDGAYYLLASVAHNLQPKGLVPPPWRPGGEEEREIREALGSE